MENSEVICAVCGNEVDPACSFCPHCQSSRIASPPSAAGPQHRLVNLEQGRPQLHQALERLRSELVVGRQHRVRVLTLIHGYGSSGKGGVIREEVRRHLGFLLHGGRINDLILGEEFSRNSSRIRRLVRRFPFLANHRDLNRANPGVTLVVL
ncbi:Smr/MutS family protein [Desulfogranum mediterraneum]|uniref:Smr/MutS family protein n=1 Tax=Desulfogranum mediterraneum TaxID=160661 RepID=UPI00041D06AF|nr:Smr/MutS family protein [Desulfogranum mediterraneum]